MWGLSKDLFAASGRESALPLQARVCWICLERPMWHGQQVGLQAAPSYLNNLPVLDQQ